MLTHGRVVNGPGVARVRCSGRNLRGTREKERHRHSAGRTTGGLSQVRSDCQIVEQVLPIGDPPHRREPGQADDSRAGEGRGSGKKSNPPGEAEEGDQSDFPN